ncbi:MAG: transposase, partial [Chloroflexota bacterium]
MKFDPLRHHRHSIRLKGYDYSRAGAYFVTMCAWHREMIFGEVVEGEMRLSEAGQMVCDVWEGLPTHYAHVELDAFVVMPNHVHGIIVLVDDEVGADVRTGRIGAGVGAGVGAGLRPAPARPAPDRPAPDPP